MGMPAKFGLAVFCGVSYGKDCPVATGHHEASSRQNRTAFSLVVGYNPQSFR
jgi:hypothetical protein